MSALLQFEDFAAPRIAPVSQYTAADLAEQFQLGIAQGAATAREAAMDELGAMLQAALTAAKTEAEIRRHAIGETLEAAVPILQALMSKLAALPCNRLIADLTSELEKLCLAGVASTCRIAGPAALIELLGTRIDRLGLTDVTLLPGPNTEITFSGGRITVDTDHITAQIGAILAEIQASMED